MATVLYFIPLSFFVSIPFAILLSTNEGKDRALMYGLDSIGIGIGAIIIWFIHTYFGFSFSFLIFSLIYLFLAILAFFGT
jgi:hypothetical protein